MFLTLVVSSSLYTQDLPDSGTQYSTIVFPHTEWISPDYCYIYASVRSSPNYSSAIASGSYYYSVRPIGLPYAQNDMIVEHFISCQECLTGMVSDDLWTASLQVVQHHTRLALFADLPIFQVDFDFHLH